MIFTFSEDYETAIEILAKGREIADSLRLELAAISIIKHDDIANTYIFAELIKFILSIQNCMQISSWIAYFHL